MIDFIIIMLILCLGALGAFIGIWGVLLYKIFVENKEYSDKID